MAIIELRNICHAYNGIQKNEKDTIYAVKDINQIYPDGSAVALLGPSGCGKTTLLEIISGLLVPTKGQIFFDGKDVTSLNAKQRHIAQVFQFPVVYDSMNVYGNLAFPLRNDGVDSDKIRERVYEVAKYLEITDLLKYSVTKLTAADKQKVSLGRGIVRPDTAAVLLDEPLTVIDPKAQWGLRRKLKQVQKELNITMIYVTHDQHEALTFAEHVTVMDVGKIEQTGSPKELHENPESTFVGYFIGSPGMNFIDVKVNPGGKLDFSGTSILIAGKIADKLLETGKYFTLGIRPEYIILYKTETESCISGKVKIVEDNGTYQIITTQIGALDIKSRAPESMEITYGDIVWLHLNQDKIKFFKEGKKFPLQPINQKSSNMEEY